MIDAWRGKIGHHTPLVNYMFAERRKRRELQRNINRLKRQVVHGADDERTRQELKGSEQELDVFEYDQLLRTARSLAVDIPNYKEKPDWWDSNSTPGMNFGPLTTYWLSDTGRTGVSRLIRDERRRNIEWWIKIVMPVMAALISLLGLIVALVTVLKNKPTH